MHEIITLLPKVLLHVHLVGSIRPSTLLDFIHESNIDSDLTTVEDIRRLFNYQDFSHFLSVYLKVVDCITDEKQFERLAYELIEDNAKHNVKYVEVSFSVSDHFELGLEFPESMKAINRGLRRAERDFKVASDVRIDLVRDGRLNYGMGALDLIEEYPENIVSIDIGGSEHKYPPGPYTSTYKRAREMGLHLVAHAGEAAGPQSIWDAVDLLGVERIGHGVSAVKDEALMEHLKKNGVAIECCPVSNLRTGVVESLEAHPIREFYDRGLLVTVNTDDPSLFNTDMVHEYKALMGDLGFNIEALLQIGLNAVDTAFISDEKRQTLQSVFFEEASRMGIRTPD